MDRIRRADWCLELGVLEKTMLNNFSQLFPTAPVWLLLLLLGALKAQWKVLEE